MFATQYSQTCLQSAHHCPRQQAQLASRILHISHSSPLCACLSGKVSINRFNIEPTGWRSIYICICHCSPQSWTLKRHCSAGAMHFCIQFADASDLPAARAVVRVCLFACPLLCSLEGQSLPPSLGGHNNGLINTAIEQVNSNCQFQLGKSFS